MSLVELKGWIGKYAQSPGEYLCKVRALDAKKGQQAPRPLHPAQLVPLPVVPWGAFCLVLGPRLAIAPSFGLGWGSPHRADFSFDPVLSRTGAMGELMKRFAEEVEGLSRMN